MNGSSVLLMGWLSVFAGCQPETDVYSMASQAEALGSEVGAWTPMAPKGFSAYNTNAILLRGTGEVLETAYGYVQRYNPYTDTWRDMSLMCSPGYCQTASLTELPSGKVLAGVVFAGRMGGTPGLMRYEPDTDTWAIVPHGHFRGRSMTVLGSGKVLMAGGSTYEGSQVVSLRSAEVYDPALETWTPVPGSMTTPRAGHSATLLYSGKVLVTGGAAPDGSGFSTAELYEPSTGTWTAAGSLPLAVGAHRAVRLYSGHVLVLSDATGSAETAVALYDPYNERWSAGPTLPLAQPISATLLYSGEVLVMNTAGRTAVYSPSLNAWLPAASATPSTSPGAAVLLHTGQVLRLNGGSPVVERFTR
ncbi:kelch repeat-containing protein [Archangium violaceum]|uniref:Kelch repeat-containing protein n=1 Tax=Archangium violaceum TaxID=83451 RepID=UPI002B310871|nr:kelch repeat-containing protein [Archangium gephyra]